jgi:hypothetical protein
MSLPGSVQRNSLFAYCPHSARFFNFPSTSSHEHICSVWSKDVFQAYEDGKLQMNSTMFQFVTDSVKNILRDKSAKRWSPETKRLLSALHVQGGKRCAGLLSLNVAGPGDTTIRHTIRQNGTVFQPGILKENFMRIAKIYEGLLIQHSDLKTVPCEMAEDETPTEKVCPIVISQ